MKRRLSAILLAVGFAVVGVAAVSVPAADSVAACGICWK